MKKSPVLSKSKVGAIEESYILISPFFEMSSFYEDPTKHNNLQKLGQFLSAAKNHIDQHSKNSYAYQHLIQLYNDVFRIFTALQQSGLPRGTMAYDNYSGKNIPIHSHIATTIKCLYRNMTDPRTIPTPEITKAVQQVNHDPSILHVQQGLKKLLTDKFKFTPKLSDSEKDGISLVLTPGCIQDTHKEWFIKKLQGNYRFEFEPVEGKAGHSRIIIRHVECQRQIEELVKPAVTFTIEAIENGECLVVPDTLKDEYRKMIMIEMFKLYPNIETLKKIDSERISHIGFLVGNQIIDKLLQQNSVKPSQ